MSELRVGCATRKIRFEDRAEADAKLAEIRASGRGHGEKRSYPCSQCCGWHLTSKKWDPTRHSRQGDRRER